jgi:hypothetical protein
MKPAAASGYAVRLMIKPNLTSQKRDDFYFENDSTIFDMITLLLLRWLFRFGEKEK